MSDPFADPPPAPDPHAAPHAPRQSRLPSADQPQRGGPPPPRGPAGPGERSWVYPAFGDDDPPGAVRRPLAPRARRLLLLGLVIGGLAALAGGTGGLVYELNRPATPAEVAAAAQVEVASRWERIPAGQIFPAVVDYVTADGVPTAAHRVGIVRPASCASALDPAVASLLRRHGCRTVLRATYVDATGALAATLGVAVLPSTEAADAVQSGAGPAGGWDHAGVRAAAFPGTVAGGFADAARQTFSAQFAGPYVLLVTTGYTDGRTARRGGPGQLGDLEYNLTGPVSTALTSIQRTCARKDVSC